VVRARFRVLEGRARRGVVPTGRATSASADTDIVVVPALVLSGGTRRGAFAIKRQVSKKAEESSREIWKKSRCCKSEEC